MSMKPGELDKIRIALGWSQHKLAERCFIGTIEMQKALRGERVIPAATEVWLRWIATVIRDNPAPRTDRSNKLGPGGKDYRLVSIPLDGPTVAEPVRRKRRTGIQAAAKALALRHARREEQLARLALIASMPAVAGPPVERKGPGRPRKNLTDAERRPQLTAPLPDQTIAAPVTPAAPLAAGRAPAAPPARPLPDDVAATLARIDQERIRMQSERSRGPRW
jgi:hypothetical protein